MSVSGLELQEWRRNALRQANLLNETGASDLKVELDWLLQAVAGLDCLALHLALAEAQIKLPLSLSDLSYLWQQRIERRVPIQYLAGATSWREFSLNVSPAVLIPRPETESLIDLVQAARHGASLEPEHWADVGTGSGAIALGLASVLPAASIHAIDCSAAALAVAQQNAQNLGFALQIQFYQGSWLAPLDHLKGNLSGLVANPPYIPTAMIPDLQPEVAWHEPRVALDGGADGLDCLRHLIAIAPDYLHSGGVLLLEMMAGQAKPVIELLQQGNYCQIEIHADLSGIERFAVAYRL